MSYTDLGKEGLIIAEGKIANALKSTAADHVVAKAENIYDTGLKGYQSEINDNFTNKFENQSEINNNFTNKFNDYLLLTGGTISGNLTINGNINGNVNGNATSADKSTDSDKLGGQPAADYVLKTNIATEAEIKALFTSQVN